MTPAELRDAIIAKARDIAGRSTSATVDQWAADIITLAGDIPTLTPTIVERRTPNSDRRRKDDPMAFQGRRGGKRRGQVRQYDETPSVAEVAFANTNAINLEPTQTAQTPSVTVTSAPWPDPVDGALRPRTLEGMTITYETSNAAVATINGSGLVTGVGNGSCTVNALCEGVRSATISVTVTTPQSTVHHVDVTPTTASVAVSGSTTLSASPEDSSNNLVTGQTVTWQSLSETVATVGADSGNDNHQVTVTGVSAGQAIVRATCNSIVSNDCTVTVSVTDYVNQPSGHTTLVDHDFDTTASWFNIGGAETVTVISDAGAPKSPPDVIEYAYIDASLGSFAGRKWAFAEQSELYVCIWFKIQDPWDYHSSSVNKMFFIDTNSSASLDNEVVFSLIGSSEANAQMRGIAQTPEGGSYRTCNVASGFWSLGDWHKLEIVMLKSTSGAANGTMRWWIDGDLKGNHTNVQYKTSGDGKFDGFLLQPYYGGTPEDKAQVDKIFYDHLYVSGKV